ncbi:phosphonate ABC transporter, permease protein [Hyphomonas neptunium ATCC 15444]|uniref:Phosphonate ABC transporter, permease protein n=2 Tax=Hyphomonas TaxID=85 RepID=Q0BZD7_HYPNA|nr:MULTISPECIES: phosphonate ABC transporter, permease protein PhnE [Hyphomonas]ABI78653.1 phosphonate ABC transporter, permease protein [Hyphomonas neptunium ATCC 15444]KCZ95245.1 phosphonate ABC transporter permease [Hyphomonas hirschiana VP5]
MTAIANPPVDRLPNVWRRKPVFGVRSLIFLIAGLIFMIWSAPRVELGVLTGNAGELIASLAGRQDTSQIERGLTSISDKMFPIVLDERTLLSADNIPGDNKLPVFAYVERSFTQETALNPETLEIETRQIPQNVLVQPFGYVFYVCSKMLQSIEMAIWASVIAMVASLLLMPLAAMNFTPHPLIRAGVRAFVSFTRTIPELVSALFLVLLFGFGPVAGILALAIHSIGFLAKFYAEEVETADIRPQEALTALGAGPLTVLRIAVIPNVIPSFVALTLYVVDRNIRMATVIGLVGAGGIGQELKGRFDMLQYGHVGTILLIIFITVLILDFISGNLRRHTI